MQFKTTPMSQQMEAWERSKDLDAFALTMEQGTGKSKVIVDNVAYLYNLGRVDALLVFAPNGVHRNWINKEIAKHLPDYIPRTCCAWSSNATAAWKKSHHSMLMAVNTLRVFTLNIECLAMPRALDAIMEFLRVTKAMVVIDESTRIKTHDSKRTENALKLRKYAPYRRILSGTVAPNSPLDVFSQYSFLDPDIFHTRSFTLFRARYAELMPADHPLIQSIMRKANLRRAPVLVATDDHGRPIYKNLDELKALLDPYTYRCRKKDCLDLPPKVYARIPVELSAEQAKLYRDLLRRLKDGLLPGEVAGKPLTKLNKLMYLQRILCGVVPAPMTEDGVAARIHAPEHNPRIKAMMADIEESDDSHIIWARFTDDIEAISEILRKTYGEDQVVQYYGETSDKDRDAAVLRFSRGDARFFVANQAAGGTGLDGLQDVASSVHYYSNSFNLEHRLQSEDRAHRIGTKGTVRYVDYETEGSVDSHIIDALLNKKNIADEINGDEWEKWLS